MTLVKTCILIPHYHTGQNSTWVLKQCLRSILEWEPDLLPHTMILDDASPDPGKWTALKLLADSFQCSIAYKRQNESYSANINMGLKLAREHGYDIAVTLNNDVELKSPFQIHAEYLFGKCPKLGTIGGLLYFPDGRIQNQGFMVNVKSGIEAPGTGGWEPNRKTGFVHGVTGAYQILRLATVGDYPTEFPLSYEDVAFCMRNWERGVWTYYESMIIGTHHESATRGKQLGEKEHESLLKIRQTRFDFEKIEAELREAGSLSLAEGTHRDQIAPKTS